MHDNRMGPQQLQTYGMRMQVNYRAAAVPFMPGGMAVPALPFTARL